MKLTIDRQNAFGLKSEPSAIAHPGSILNHHVISVIPLTNMDGSCIVV